MMISSQMKKNLKNRFASALACKALLALCIAAPMIVQSATFHTRIYTNAVGTRLRYVLTIPTNYDPTQKYTVVLYFHAATTTPTDDLG